MIFLTSCAPNVNDKTTTESTTTDITEQKIQIDSKKISDNFTWDDYLKYAQSEGAVIVDLENYFNAYFFVIYPFAFNVSAHNTAPPAAPRTVL